MTGRRFGTLSPRKNLRSSTRDRSALDRSLRENSTANDYTKSRISNRRLEKKAPSSSHSSPRRNRRNCLPGQYKESSDDDEFIRPSKRCHKMDYSPEENVHEEDEELPSNNKPKRRRVRTEEEEEEETHDESAQQLENGRRSSLRHKHLKDESEASPGGDVPIKTARNIRQTKRNEKSDIGENNSPEEIDREETTEEEEDEDDPDIPRQYTFRQRLTPVQRTLPNDQRRNKRPIRRNTRQERYRSGARDVRRNSDMQDKYKKRICRYDSSSTGSDDDDRKEDERFEKRKKASMLKARNRFQPINIGESDMNCPLIQQRERMRQTGASCADVDPMAIDRSTNFDQVGGLGEHIQSLKEVVLFPLLYPEVFNQFNIQAPKGVVFYGPPGTGKTLVARALANECSKGSKKVAFFMRKGADCLSKWVGESERQLRILFDEAYTMRPSIIFFDEIDGLAPVRSSKQDQIHSSIVSTLLALMDGLDSRGEVIVIGATNRLDAIDPALRRPGRFDRELKFSLPDVQARKTIINIHTSAWNECKPSSEVINWLAENTSGYCGADLKYLCTETVLLAMRERYPHIYMSTDKLNIDTKEIRITKEHMKHAMNRIIPASRRDLSIPSRPLDERTSILLSTTVDSILNSNIPNGYRRSHSIQSTSTNELEKVVRGLEPPPPVPAVRLLICGNEECYDCGQTSFVLPALLSKMDHLPVYSLAIHRLFADGRPEETLANTIHSALRSAEKGPCVILLPSFDQWIKCVSDNVFTMLSSFLEQITGFTSIMLLATVDSFNGGDDILSLFSTSNIINVPTVAHPLRRRYVEALFANAYIPPRIFDASKYVFPGLAEENNQPVRKLSEIEAKDLEKVYSSHLRELRIFFRDQLGRLIRDRRFNVFAEPVDVEDAEDYYDVIKQPMSFADMMEKIDEKEYIHPDQFLEDINLIISNAIEYNPPDCMNGKQIRHTANALRDIVEAYFEKEFDEKFVEEIERVAQLLKEANIEPKHEKLLDLPNGFVRHVTWNASHSFQSSKNANRETHKLRCNSKKFRRNSSHGLPSNNTKKISAAAILNSIKQSLDEPTCSDSNMESPSQVQMESGLEEAESVATDCATPSSLETNLVVDELALQDCINTVVNNTDTWGAPQLENLAAEICNVINGFSARWDRTELSADVKKLLVNYFNNEFDA